MLRFYYETATFRHPQVGIPAHGGRVGSPFSALTSPFSALVHQPNSG